MKSYIDAIIQREQAEYLDTLLPHRDELFIEMESYSSKHSIPSSDPEIGMFLDIIARAINAKNALEIGTAIGYGAITLALAMGNNSSVTTIDPNREITLVARDFMRRAGVDSRIEIIESTALDALPDLRGPYDLAYIDAVKEEYNDYLKLIIPKVRKGGVILADNVLWKGQVATRRLLSQEQKESTEALIEFNKRFTTHPELKGVILPFGDGLAFGIKL